MILYLNNGRLYEVLTFDMRIFCNQFSEAFVFSSVKMKFCKTHVWCLQEVMILNEVQCIMFIVFHS